MTSTSLFTKKLTVVLVSLACVQYASAQNNTALALASNSSETALVASSADANATTLVYNSSTTNQTGLTLAASPTLPAGTSLNPNFIPSLLGDPTTPAGAFNRSADSTLLPAPSFGPSPLINDEGTYPIENNSFNSSGNAKPISSPSVGKATGLFGESSAFTGDSISNTTAPAAQSSSVTGNNTADTTTSVNPATAETKSLWETFKSYANPLNYYPFNTGSSSEQPEAKVEDKKVEDKAEAENKAEAQNKAKTEDEAKVTAGDNTKPSGESQLPAPLLVRSEGGGGGGGGPLPDFSNYYNDRFKELHGRADRLESDIKKNDKKAMRGIAAVAAMSGAIQPSAPGKTVVGVGAATYEGVHGFALMVSHRPEKLDQISLQAAVAASSGGKPVMRIGVSYQF